MTACPKHYLAEVPHELRMRVLDLCIHRQWHDAIDLLHQNGFTQYEWWEVVWFHDHAPTNLEPRSADSLSASESAESTISPTPEPRTENPELATLTGEGTLTPVVGRVVPGEPNLNTRSVKLSKPRSKIARLPEDIRYNLNTMLASGRSYRDITRWLNDAGYPGFNKVNLHNWRLTGFQFWLRTTDPAIDSSSDPQPNQLSEPIDLGLNPSARGVPAAL